MHVGESKCRSKCWLPPARSCPEFSTRCGTREDAGFNSQVCPSSSARYAMQRQGRCWLHYTGPRLLQYSPRLLHVFSVTLELRRTMHVLCSSTWSSAAPQDNRPAPPDNACIVQLDMAPQGRNSLLSLMAASLRTSLRAPATSLRMHPPQVSACTRHKSLRAPQTIN